MLFARRVIFLFLIFIFPIVADAEDPSGSTYQAKQGIFCLGGPGTGSDTYSLDNIIGVNAGSMSGSLYGLSFGLQSLNSLPLATIDNYNDGRPVDDATPTLQWVYSDADNDTQKTYQLQVAHESFATPVVDSGITVSTDTSFTTPILPRTEERTVYTWRVRVNDGFGWSGWAQADNGFVLAAGGFTITGLGALSAPGGAEITQSLWQQDNDPYFYWEPPSGGLVILGYSYSLDSLPDEQLDTQDEYCYFSQDSVGDGVHTFYVIAQRSSGLWSEPASFEIWVDTTAPTLNSLVPSLGTVLSTDLPQVRVAISDVASGVNPEDIEMRINQALVTPEYISGIASYTPTVPLSDGEITVSLGAADLVGNYSLPLTWSFIIDTEGPGGSILINNDDEMTTTNVVTLNLSAEDEITDVVQMILSNDGVFDTEAWEPYISLRKNWVLPAISGTRKVYARVRDRAGNISETFFDEINLVIIAPDTYILSGPSGVTQSQSAQFTFRGSLDGCQFSYKFDNEDWSDWSGSASISRTDLPEGNHYFMVRAAKDLNKDSVFQLDEVDPTAALRVWTVSFTGALKPPLQPEKPILHWEEE